MRNSRMVSLFSFLILIMSASGFAQPENTGTRGMLDLPEVEGWEKGEPNVYPQPGLGYSVTYQSAIGGTVTVYIYDGDRKDIPDGVESSIIQNEIKKAKGDIMQAVELGYYDNAEVLKDDTVTLGGVDGSVSVLRIVLKLGVKGRDLTSEIYLFGYKGNFIKFRATRAEEIEGLQNKAVTDLFAALDKSFEQ